MKPLAPLFALLLFVAAMPAWAQVEIQHPWARATPPGAKVAAGYLALRNPAGTPDRLVSIVSPAAARVETHVHIRDGDVMRMREVKGYDIPAKGALELRPGGAHLMFIDIKRPFKEGERIPATLRFASGGEAKVEFEVGGLGASGPAHAH